MNEIVQFQWNIFGATWGVQSKLSGSCLVRSAELKTIKWSAIVKYEWAIQLAHSLCLTVSQIENAGACGGGVDLPVV